MPICFMRATIDIPDVTYKTLETTAVEDDSTVRQSVLNAVDF